MPYFYGFIARGSGKPAGIGRTSNTVYGKQVCRYAVQQLQLRCLCGLQLPYCQKSIARAAEQVLPVWGKTHRKNRVLMKCRLGHSLPRLGIEKVNFMIAATQGQQRQVGVQVRTAYAAVAYWANLLRAELRQVYCPKQTTAGTSKQCISALLKAKNGFV